ncbi:MAG TPA: glutamate-1-semialdehyde 2,1-aminomutase [Candidatus Limnocylindria bacterium]|nr:glutamate-1-semialdehyde 2,1-aminomutase [Candidatus Limnocylindria bacterium]
MTRVTSAGQADLRERAAALFPGGVNSPVRAFRAVGGEALVIERGEGAYVWDADGRRYLDLVATWGATILGHAHPAVTDAIRRTAGEGLAFGATHPSEMALGERIRARLPSIERLRFTSSGTEAVMSALRLARAATGRDLVLKFAGAYHGHVDALLAEAGSGLATLALPGSAGVPPAVAALTVVLPFNDIAAVEHAFAAHHDRIAAVIVEPVVANAGVLAPADGYLAALREMTASEGALLIFDEVITGFRLGPGGAQRRFGVTPDLTVLGKIIGGGMPIGAYGGRIELMSLVAPDGPVYQAGTLAGHPLAMAAGAATLDAIDPSMYVALEQRTERLAGGLVEAGRAAGRQVAVGRAGPLLTLFFRRGAPVDATQAFEADRAAYARFHRRMLEAGVLLPPSQFEAWFPGFAHGDAEIEAVIAAVVDALQE